MKMIPKAKVRKQKLKWQDNEKFKILFKIDAYRPVLIPHYILSKGKNPKLIRDKSLSKILVNRCFSWKFSRFSSKETLQLLLSKDFPVRHQKSLWSYFTSNLYHVQQRWTREQARKMCLQSKLFQFGS